MCYSVYSWFVKGRLFTFVVQVVLDQSTRVCVLPGYTAVRSGKRCHAPSERTFNISVCVCAYIRTFVHIKLIFTLRLYGVRYMVKNHSVNERGNPLPPHGLHFPISSKGSFICIIPPTG